MTGKELWKYSGNSEIAIPTPIIGPGFVVITNGYRGVQPIVAVKPGATGDITLKTGETKSEFIAWGINRGGPYIPTPVIYGDQLYVLQNNGVLAAYKVATGERIYQERLGGTGGSFSASPVAADGKIYARAKTATSSSSRRGRPTSCSRRTRSAKCSWRRRRSPTA